jgi:putative ABC transport system permease protein
MSFLRDIKLAFRLFWRTPALTGIALVSIALSVGATAVVFAAVRSVLISPLPYARPGELVQIRTEFPRFGASHSDWALWHDSQEIIRRTRTLSSVGTYRNEILNLATGSAPPEALYGLRASASLFPTLGVTPMLGRNISPDEDQPGHANAMILSYGLWARRFHSDPRLIGRTVIIDGHDCLVIGVMPKGFNFPLRRGAVHTPSPYVDFWAPLRSGKPVKETEAVGVVARLRPGVSLSEAQQDLASISGDLSREFPPTNRDHSLRLGLLRDRTVGNAGKALYCLMAAAVMFLLIGCANVANLLLARGLSRQREIAIRIAIGADQRRIVRQLLTESCLLAAVGGIGGYILTLVAWKLLPSVAPISIPRLAAARADWQVFAFALTVALLNGILFGMVPALRSGRTSATSAQNLRAHSGISGGRDRVRGALVTIEVALAVSLVVVGGQLLASFAGLLGTDPGFDAKHVLASVIIPASNRYHSPEQQGMLFKRILDAVRVLPGVESAGTVDALPFSGENHGGMVSGGESQTAAEVDVVSAGYLQTMGVRLTEGRWFGDDDMKESGNGVIVNEIAAGHLWPGTSAVGKRICVACSPEKPDNWKQVVGVISNIRHAAMDEPQGASVYVAASALENAAFLVVKSDQPAGEMERAIRGSIAQVDPNQPVFLSASMQTLIADSLADRRFIMGLLAITGCLALAMAAAGVYGVATYVTSRRTQEIGLRMALGGTRSEVEALIFGQGFRSAAMGLGIGLLSTLILMRVAGGLLPGLKFGNFGNVGIEAGLVSLTVAVACWLPARRASKIDPMFALRQE